MSTDPANGTDPFDARNRLVDDVLHGRLTPDQAEVEAKRLELEPLEWEPSPQEFDSSAELHWSVPMAVAWIASRDLNVVRECWDSYRLACRRWRSTPELSWPDLPARSWTLEPKDPAHLGTVTTLLRRRSDAARRTDSSWEDLVQKLRAGSITAVAIDVSTSKPVEIDRLQWKILSPVKYGDNFALSGGGKIFIEIDLPRKIIEIDIWPKPTASAASRSFAEEDAKLIAKMRMLVTNGKAKSAQHAAELVAREAQRLGTPESVIERLRKRYGREYPQRRRR